jgi:tRNA-specific 2-thiouridylase
VLGDEEDLEKEDMRVAKLNWIKYEGLNAEMEAITKIRYKDKGSLSSIIPSANGVSVRFTKRPRALHRAKALFFTKAMM